MSDKPATVEVQEPGSPIPPGFDVPFQEIEAILDRLRNTNKVDKVEPLLGRLNELKNHCNERLASSRRFLDEIASQ